MIKDLVSVIIPTYNDAKYLKNSLDDIINQTYKNIEIIVVNDGSTDNTEEILKEYKDNNSNFYYYNKDNGGTGSALNLGFSKAKGEFATWISSDDRKELFMIERLVEFLKKNRDCEYVVSAFYSQYLNNNFRSFIAFENEKGYLVNKQILGGECSGKSFLVDEWVEINRQLCHSGVNYMFTMRLKNECGDFLCIPGEDYFMSVLMGAKTRVGYIDEVLGQHNNPIDSLSMQNRSCVNDANLKTWNYIDNNYNFWNVKNVPKIAHFYWGSNKLSFMRYMTIYSFKKLNPDWSVILYVPKEVNSFKNWQSFHQSDSCDYQQEKDYTNELKKMPIKIIEVDFTNTLVKDAGEAQRSDYLRWNLLYQKGGAWFDMDILFIKPLSELAFNNLNNCYANLFLTFDERHCNELPIGALFTSPKTQFYKDVCNQLKLVTNLNDYQAIGINILNKIIFNEQYFKTKYSNLKIINFNFNNFYLLDYKNLIDIYKNNFFEKLKNNKEVIGIHWYGGDRMSSEFNNIINHENYINFNNTICNAIKFVMEK